MYPILILQSEATAARRRIPIWLVDATDGIASEISVTGTPRIAKNGVSSAAASASIVEVDSTNMPGLYYLELTAGEVDTLGTIYISFKTAATAQWHGICHVVDFDPFDGVRMGMTALPNAAAEAAGGLFTRGTGAGQINQPANGLIDVNVEQWLDSVVNALVSGRVDASVGVMAANVLTAAAMNADASEEIADAVWDENIEAAHGTDATAGLLLRAIGAGISNRANNATLDALLGVADAAGVDLPDQVLDGDTLTELGQAIPAATPTLRAAIMLLYMAFRNKRDVTASIDEVHDDAGVIVATAALTDDATTFSRAEMIAGT